ncbi:60Kd inner membrane protein-domain-containing protein [Cadophora sp. MPI-SDFR-AT-0126]|nr:60Kd inner membrane protein-domain-containing protein [Leotiomycetes sp. MPI-SDFR-AT-0126]
MPLLRTLRPSTTSSTISPALKNLLLLPPSCRITNSTNFHSNFRSFHATPRPQSLLLTSIHLSHDALTSLHTFTGLPWCYSIPLFALLLRTTLILPLSIYARRSTVKQISLIPLIESWKHPLRHETMREVGHLGPNVAQSTLLKKIRRKRGEIYKRHGCGTWKNFLSMAQIPVFLSVMEALRKMCGSKQGILGLMLGGNEVMEAGKGAMGADSRITGDGLLDTAINIPLETSLATEGALWFPNLLLADPHLVLPFALSGTILLNILGGRTPYAAMGLWRQRITRSLSLVALCIGPLMLNVPSALLIYWISSSGTAYLQGVLLNKFMPLPKPVLPCEPKGQWKSGFGSPKPEGYVNPLLAMEKAAAAKALDAKKAVIKQKPVLDQNKPIGKSIPKNGK